MLLDEPRGVGFENESSLGSACARRTPEPTVQEGPNKLSS